MACPDGCEGAQLPDPPEGGGRGLGRALLGFGVTAALAYGRPSETVHLVVIAAQFTLADAHRG